MNQLENKIIAGQSKNNEWIDTQYPFDGEWMPDVDPALIGPRNFADIKNLRYNDKSIEGVNGYTFVNTAALTELNVRDGIQLRTNKPDSSFLLAHATDDSTAGKVYINTGSLGAVAEFEDSENIDPTGKPTDKIHYMTDSSPGLTPRFSKAPQNSVVYCNEEDTKIFSGYEHRIAAAFGCNSIAGVDVIDISDMLTNKDESTYIRIDSAPTGSERSEIHIMTTRPVQGFYFYVASANVTTSTMSAHYWDGDQFTACDALSDGTSSGGISLAQDGYVRFSHTGGNADGSATGGDASTLGVYAEFKHFQELYLYCYRLTISAGSAAVYQVTCDPGAQPVQNVWDGVYRQPIQCQFWNDSDDAYEDYTIQVNVSSDLQQPAGAQIDAATPSDHLIIMFEEQVSAIRLTMLGSLVNTNASQLAVYYWTGTAWANVGASNLQDGTENDSTTTTLTKSGLVSWQPLANEQKQTLFNSLGYAYKFIFTFTLSGEEGADEDIVIDFITGIPALLNSNELHESRPFKFSTPFQNRLMLGGYTSGGEGNRMDFSVTNAPDVFNGHESSMDGRQSLYFGGVEELTGAVSLYNRFGASVYSMLVVFKDTELYLMVGYNPTNFVIYPVATTVGCPAPHTIDTAEMGIDIGQGLSRNIVIWLSHYGPMVFDGAVLKPLTGINNFFDHNEDVHINWDAIDKARGWVDQTYKEYNLLIPTGDSTSCDTWLCYDLIRKKWFQKHTGIAELPQCGFNIMNPSTGQQMVYGGIPVGKLIQMEKGTSWGCTYADETSGESIEQTVKVGDTFPSDNIWDETLIRKFKLICQKVPSSVNLNAQTLVVNYYGETTTESSNVSFQDSNAAAGINVDFTDLDAAGDGEYETMWESASINITDLQMGVGLDRLIRVITDMNNSNWIHSFRFTVTTNNVNKGWQPIVWGLRYRVERKDDTATEISVV